MNLGNQNSKYSWRIRDLENPQTGTHFANSVLMYKISPRNSFLLCMNVNANDQQSQSWKVNFVLCIEMSVNDWQCWSWKDNFVLCIGVSYKLTVLVLEKTTLCCVLRCMLMTVLALERLLCAVY